MAHRSVQLPPATPRSRAAASAAGSNQNSGLFQQAALREAKKANGRGQQIACYGDKQTEGELKTQAIFPKTRLQRPRDHARDGLIQVLVLEGKPMSEFMSHYLVPAAIIAVAIVLLLGLVNMMRGGSPNRSQKLMRLRVLFQFIAIIIIMATIWAMGR
jgi:hypothetical protein